MVYSIYVALLGLVTLGFGCADILVWAGASDGFTWGILTITGDDFFRWAWGGVVMACGGVLLISGAAHAATSLHQAAKVAVGAILVWLIAGTDLLAMLCAAIPADASSPAFLNTPAGFFAGFAPPYTPAVLLLPFTVGLLLVFRGRVRRHET
ncbi:hypothetical protein AZH53_07885 [Methanomicrobiaceae archaeon CYW5]|nr:hypothetical protein [Methanovulcanius yangii]